MAEVVYRASEAFTYSLSGDTYDPDNWGQAMGNSQPQTYWDLSDKYYAEQVCLSLDLTDPIQGTALAAGDTITSAILAWRNLGHGNTAQTVESYVFSWLGPGPWGHDVSGDWRTIAQLQTLHASGSGVCFSCALPAGWMGESDKTFTSGPAAASAVQNAIGGTLKLIFVVANFRAGNTPTGRFYCSWARYNDSTPASRPTLTVQYDEGGGGPSIPVIVHHLREQGIA